MDSQLSHSVGQLLAVAYGDGLSIRLGDMNELIAKAVTRLSERIEKLEEAVGRIEGLGDRIRRLEEDELDERVRKPEKH